MRSLERDNKGTEKVEGSDTRRLGNAFPGQRRQRDGKGTGMTTKQAIEKLSKFTESSDREYSHLESDEIILELLKSLGHHDVVEAYEKVKSRVDGFWYA
jgi:hypothetical protein